VLGRVMPDRRTDAEAPGICGNIAPSVATRENRLDYWLITSNILHYRNLSAYFKGEIMSFTKYINYDTLTEAEKKALKKQLQDHKKALQDALADADKGLAALTSRKGKKSKKKSKK
jgi:hypothetical protein